MPVDTCLKINAIQPKKCDKTKGDNWQKKNKIKLKINIINNILKQQNMSTLESIANPVGGLLGAGVNAFMQDRANKQSRQFAREMFDKTNAYNAPEQQVKRMKEAGLNPALMYQGSPVNTAQQGHQADSKAYQMPENLLGEAFKTLAETKKIQGETVPPTVTINNVLADTANKEQNTETSKQSALKMATEAAKVQQEYNMNQQLWETNKQYRKEQLRNLEQANVKLEKELEYMTPTQKQQLANLQASYDQTVKQTKKLDNENWVLENNQKLQAAGINPNGSNMFDTVLRFIIQNGARLLSND
jgi:hypothetical protein